MSLDLFITCAETLEPLLVKELHDIGYVDAKPSFRGVTLPYSMQAVYEINYLSRLAGRVLLPLAKFPCKDAKELYTQAKKLDWLKYISENKTLAIDVNGKHKAFNNTLYAAQVLKDALCDHCKEICGKRPSVNVQSPDVQLSLFLQNDYVTISLDTSGEPLFKRGYRRECVTAPLQESLAAAFLMMANYKGDEILLDVCCGSGTLLIEAALMATRTPPGYLRRKWGFFNLPEYSETAFEDVKKIHQAKICPLKEGLLYGYEINRENVRIANVNIRTAGFHDGIQVMKGAFQEGMLSILPNLVICNPPHGLRLEDEESLKPLYRALGDFFKHKMAKPSKAFIFTTSPVLAKEVGLKPHKRHIVKSSGDEGRLLEFDIY
ncbi:MAG: THUMP domain-containing protein [Chlamydiales bacterium]|nr:THUMP domain-containing protein [Chlamydiales bacterium]